MLPLTYVNGSTWGRRRRRGKRRGKRTGSKATGEGEQQPQAVAGAVEDELRISCDAAQPQTSSTCWCTRREREGGKEEGSKCRVALAAVEGVAGDGCGETHDGIDPSDIDPSDLDRPIDGELAASEHDFAVRAQTKSANLPQAMSGEWRVGMSFGVV